MVYFIAVLCAHAQLTKICVFLKARGATVNFSYFLLEFTAGITILCNSKVKCKSIGFLGVVPRIAKSSLKAP